MRTTDLFAKSIVRTLESLSFGLLLAGLGNTVALAGEVNSCAPNFSDYMIEVFSSTQSPNHSPDPAATVYVPSFINGYKVLSGGAIVHTMQGNAFLTASYPEMDAATTTPIGWVGESKHLGSNTQARITTYAIALFDPNDCWEVKVFSASTTSAAAHPAQTAALDAGYVLVGGGAKVPQHSGANGNFLFKSVPNSSGNGWDVQSKDHGVSDPSTITAYAIGVKAKGAGMVTPTSYSLAGKPSTSLNNPMAYANGANNIFPGRDCTMTGGGAHDRWTGYGNLLSAMFPSGTTSWDAYGRSYGTADSSIMTAYVVCLR